MVIDFGNIEVDASNIGCSMVNYVTTHKFKPGLCSDLSQTLRTLTIRNFVTRNVTELTNCFISDNLEELGFEQCNLSSVVVAKHCFSGSNIKELRVNGAAVVSDTEPVAQRYIPKHHALLPNVDAAALLFDECKKAKHIDVTPLFGTVYTLEVFRHIIKSANEVETINLGSLTLVPDIDKMKASLHTKLLGGKQDSAVESQLYCYSARSTEHNHYVLVGYGPKFNYYNLKSEDEYTKNTLKRQFDKDIQ